MNRMKRDTVLGLVFFGTMAFLLWATVNLTDVSLGDRPPMEVYFNDAGGIRVGDPVLLLGKRVGKVSEIEFIEARADHRMKLTLRISDAFELREDHSIQVQDAGVLGGKQVYINPGNSQVDWPDGTEKIGETNPNPLEAAAGFFDGTGTTGQELLGLLTDVRQFFDSLNDPDTSSIGAAVNRRELYDEVLSSVQILRGLFQSVDDGEGILGRIIKDPTLRDDTLQIVANLARVSEQLNGTESTIGRLLNDGAMSAQLGDIVSGIDGVVTRLSEGRGMASLIINDEELGRTLADSINSMASILEKADDPDAGTLGMILGDLELRADLRDVAANLQSVTRKLDEGQGLLSLLINDVDISIRFRRILNQVSRALEDAREAAPISNFVQVLLGTF